MPPPPKSAPPAGSPPPRHAELRPAAADPGGARDPASDYADRLAALLGVGFEARSARDAAQATMSPALDWARSGAMALTGESDGPPRFAAGPVATAARGAGLLLEALAPGRGFAELDAPALLGERAALVGLGRRGATACGGTTRLLPTRDRPLALALPREDDWRLLEAWLEVDLPGVARARDWAAIACALAARDSAALVDRGRELGLALAEAVAAPVTVATPFRLEHATTSAASRAATRAATRASTPHGRRVLDLSSLWAGPLAGSLLAQAGYDVLKIESPLRPDGARNGTRPGEPAFFDRLNAGKRGAALDLTTTADRALFARLLDATDVVLESARPRALAQLGFDARAWVAERPGRLWVSVTGHGREHEWIAFGDDAAIAAGLAYDPGPGSLGPRFCADAIADPLTGLHAAVAVLALERAGRGGLLGLALAEVAAFAARESTCAEPLTLPMRCENGDWIVFETGCAHPVAQPRSRPGIGRAPALVPPDEDLIMSWTAAC